MTLSPPGAQLAPIDLPPPPPAVDPREPSPNASTTLRGRTSRTPQRPRSPIASRGTSPVRHSSTASPLDRTPVAFPSDPSPPPLAHPVPRPLSSASPSPMNSLGHSHHPLTTHLSRPSSPSSIHSSTSAIFERDIEYPNVASLTLNPNPPQPHALNHKSSRLSHLSHGSALDHSVPAVLDDAVEALTGPTPDANPAGIIHGLEIEAPTASGGIGMARQSSASLHSGLGGSASRKIPAGPSAGGVTLLNSRSPSPVSVASRNSSNIASPTQSPPILGQLSTQQGQASMSMYPPDPSPTSGIGGGIFGSVPRPNLRQRLSSEAEENGLSTPHARPEELTSAAAAASTQSALSAASHSPSPPPSSSNPLLTAAGKNDKRRISFISYNDLLLSVPTTVTPLGDITSGNLSPDHLPGTISPSMAGRSPVVPSAGVGGALAGGLPVGASPLGAVYGAGVGAGGLGGVPEDSVSDGRRISGQWESSSPAGRMGLGLGDGEWGREGLGKGLEQRLEDHVHEAR